MSFKHRWFSCSAPFLPAELHDLSSDRLESNLITYLLPGLPTRQASRNYEDFKRHSILSSEIIFLKSADDCGIINLCVGK